VWVADIVDSSPSVDAWRQPPSAAARPWRIYAIQRDRVWVFYATKWRVLRIDLLVAIVEAKGRLIVFGRQCVAAGDLDCIVGERVVVAKD
jgi:hypothetical protein